jgi:hypothetical protein
MKKTLMYFVTLGIALIPVGAMAQSVPLVQDSYVTGGTATNFGSAVTMNVGGGATAQSLIQFDLSALPFGTNASNIARATLVVFVHSVGATGTVNISTANGAWTEAGVSGNNGPVAGGVVASGVSVTSANTYLVVDATTAVKTWLGEIPNNGFLIAAAGGGVNITLDTKESTTTSHPAQLLITLQAIGTAGPTGPTGANGATGPTGTNGTNGVTGPTGAGTTGATGPTGTNGTNGVTGPTGNNGTNGVTGPTGNNGTNGVTGPTGNNGANGVTGPTGTNGTNGVTGPTGTNGTNGVTGTNGTNGTNGVTGPTGTNGTNGVTGPTGTNGTNGVTGPTGGQGNTGPAGPTGTNGTNGSNGAAGPAGPTGPTGPAGSAGTGASPTDIPVTFSAHTFPPSTATPQYLAPAGPAGGSSLANLNTIVLPASCKVSATITSYTGVNASWAMFTATPTTGNILFTLGSLIPGAFCSVQTTTAGTSCTMTATNALAAGTVVTIQGTTSGVTGGVVYTAFSCM